VTAPLTMIVPTRGRPTNAAGVIHAWNETGAFTDGAALLFAIDLDDPEHEAYLAIAADAALGGLAVTIHQVPTWRPMVPKLNGAAELRANYIGEPLLGFAGDDHMPRTRGWVRTIMDQFDERGVAIVYANDGYQGESLPTSWVMRSAIVRALGGRMVPADVEHLFCDNAVRDLGRATDTIRYLPEVLIEHMHPVAGKAESDAQYERVNGRPQWRNDKSAYRLWRDGNGLRNDAAAVIKSRESLWA
jgi:hypothetical protein